MREVRIFPQTRSQKDVTHCHNSEFQTMLVSKPDEDKILCGSLVFDFGFDDQCENDRKEILRKRSLFPLGPVNVFSVD